MCMEEAKEVELTDEDKEVEICTLDELREMGVME